jgi:predicted tellurium resistance membrane protein TerC
MAGDIVDLLLLILLQAVLGFDNLLYISLESKRAPVEDRARVRRIGIGLAIGLRILLLVVLLKLIHLFQDPIFSLPFSFAHGEFNFHSLILLAGGAFILYTATKEIMHMMVLHDEDKAGNDAGSASSGKIIFWIVIMNLVFSFDSILGAIALTDVIWVMAVAIISSGLLMIWLSDRVSAFLQKNRMYEVLGLFVLFIVGIMLLTEGGHMAHLTLFGQEVHAMTKTTFYFVISVLVLIDIVQGRYQKKLQAAIAQQTRQET